jgi:hypothetical protein
MEARMGIGKLWLFKYIIFKLDIFGVTDSDGIVEHFDCMLYDLRI